MSKHFIKRSLVFLAAAFAVNVLVSCTKKGADSTATSSANPAGKAEAAGELNLAIWANYLSPEMAKKFTDQTGIKLNISNYSSNEDLLAKIQSGASAIDVAVPSDYMVAILAKQNMLNELKKDQIPNAKGLSEEFLAQAYDPENKFSLPYSWTTTGIAINRDVYKGKVESWKDVFDNDQLKGKISLMDDVREVTGAALKSEGASVNTTNEGELKKAKDILLKARKNVKLFQTDSIDILANKEVAVAQAYSSDALNAWNRTGGKIEFVLPKEGGIRAIDNVVVLKTAKNPEAAYKLINFLLSEEANVNFVKTQFGGPVLKATKDKLDEKLRNNKALFPSKETSAKLENIHDLGEKTSLYEEIWTSVKTSN